MDNERIEELLNDYNVSKETINTYYKLLSKYDFVNLDDESFYDCLELIISDISDKNNISDKRKEDKNYNSHGKSSSYIVADALYRVYGDEAVKYLDENYFELNKSRYEFK